MTRLTHSGWNARTAKRLYDLGYVTLPAHGKRLLLPDWQRVGDERLSWPALSAIAARTAPGCNISHVFGNASDLIGVDIDVMDPEVSERIQIIATKFLGDSPFLRVGRWPKVALYYRKSGTGHKTIRHPGLEIFASSGQMVLFGIHPDTRKPYLWPKRSPLNAESHCLPAVTPGQIKGFLQAAIPLAAGCSERPGREERTAVPIAEMRREREAKFGLEYRDILLEQLGKMDPAKGNRHYTVVSIIASMFHRGYSAENIHSFLDGPYVKRFGKLDRTDRHRKIDRIIKSFERKSGRNRGRKNRV